MGSSFEANASHLHLRMTPVTELAEELSALALEFDRCAHGAAAVARVRFHERCHLRVVSVHCVRTLRFVLGCIFGLLERELR